MQVHKKNEVVTLEGVQPDVGMQAPSFSLKNLQDQVISLVDFKGQAVLLSIVPDIDTKICSLQTKRFNQEASRVKGAKFITISNNTKEEQKNWCAAEGVDMELLHDTEDVFGQAYGLFILEMKRLARAIFIIDAQGVIAYRAISTEITEEPDYAKALEKLQQLT